MVGMIQILIYLLCIHLVFRGIEIYQIALMSSKEDNISGIKIGGVMLTISIIVALYFFYITEDFANSLSNSFH